MSGYRGLTVRLWGMLALAGLLACSRSPEPPPTGLAGLAFGDSPGPGLVAVRVPLPAELGDILAYRTRPGPAGAFHGQALAEPVFAFLRDRLFAVAALLADPAGEGALVRELEVAYGPPLVRRGPGGLSRLWRLDGVDLILDHDAAGLSRVMVRSRDLARELAGWRDQELPLERDADN